MRRRPLAPLLLAQPSRFAGWPQNAARMMLAALAALLLAALVAMGTPNPDVGAPSDGMSDAVLYGTIVDNVRHGGDYYAVAADALRLVIAERHGWTVGVPDYRDSVVL